MPGRLTPGRWSSSGQSNGTTTPQSALTPLEGGLGGDDTGSRPLSKNHSTFSFTAGTPETPTRRGSTVGHTSSLSRSAGVTALLRPTNGAPAPGLPLPAGPHTPGSSPHHALGSNGPREWASGSEFAGVSEPSGLRGVTEGPSQTTPKMPELTTVSFIKEDSAAHSAKPLPSTAAMRAATSASPAETSATSGLGGEAAALSSSSPGRSLTLLERRTNRERSMMSISCLSGLNVETIQASMRDVSGGAAADPRHKAMPQSHGWSKSVASAALLGDYEAPRTSLPANSGEKAGSSSVAAVVAPTPAISAVRGLPAATPAYRGSGAAVCRRASVSPQRGADGTPLNNGSVASAPTPAAVQRTCSLGPAAPKTLDAIPGAIKVASYNILASRLASTDLYPHCPPSVLSEEYRVNLVKEEVRVVDPDILLMEEISVAVHEESLGPFLKATLGLEGHHAVITDRAGHPRCSTRPPTAGGTPSSKAPSSTRKKFDGLSLASLRGTSANAHTPMTPPSATSAGRGVGDVATFAVSEGRGDACLPPLVRTGSGVHPPSLCGSGVLSCPPPIRRKGSRSPQPHHVQPSLSSMGTTHTTVGVATASVTTPSHGDVMQRSHSASNFTSIAAAAMATAAGPAAQESSAEPPTTAATAQPTPPPATTPTDGTAAGCSENHRRIEMDGVAVYYRASRFRVLEVVPVHFNAIATTEDRLTPYEHQKLQVNSHNVALLTVLHDTHAPGMPHVYIIAAVHFIWQRINAQLWQAHQLLRVMEELKTRYSKCDVDLAALAMRRRSFGADSVLTQPPSLAETPLHHELGRPYKRRDPPLSAASARRASVSQHPPTAASDSTLEGSSLVHVGAFPSHLTAADRAFWRRESVVSTSTNAGGVIVTCLIGGDFNSDRSGPVMEYLRTGRVPDGAQVMDYWKSPAPSTPSCRRQTNAEATTTTPAPLDAAVNDGEGVKDGAATLEPLPALPVIVAHTPSPRQRGRDRRRGEAVPPRSRSTSATSFGSPPSPTQPSMQPRRQTQSPPQALGVDAAVLSAENQAAFLLQPSTPPRQRPSKLFNGRLREGSTAAALNAGGPRSREVTLLEDTQISVSVIAADAEGQAATIDTPLEDPYQVACMNNFRFGRGSASLMTSPVSATLAELTADRSGLECGSAPTVAVTPSARVMAAAAVTSARTRGRSQDSQSSLSQSSRRQKTFKSGSQTNNEFLFSGSGGSVSLHSRRRTSPEALRSNDSSALTDATPPGKPSSRSHSISEHESVLSNPFGANASAMRLPQHARTDVPAPQLSDASWGADQERKSSQSPPLPPHRSSHSSSSGRPRKPSPALLSPFSDSPADATGLVTPAKADRRVKPLPAFTAAAMADLGGGDGVFDSLIHPQLSQMDNCEAPPAPKAGAKRRSVKGAAHTMSGTSANGTSSTPPISPQAARPCPDVTGSTGTSPATLSLERVRSPAEDPHLSPASPASSASGSSHAAAWTAMVADPLPSKPAKGLIDDVAHAVRFSDAYAPYCHRHPTRVSAVNPSTNMEGRVLDHILYEDENVVCGAVLRLGEKQELPNARVPSDHYMIGALLIPIHELH